METSSIQRITSTLRRAIGKIAGLYHWRSIRERGWLWASGLAVVTLTVILFVVGIIWSAEPDPFDVREKALERAGGDDSLLVPGYLTTSTLMGVVETMLDKPGGYLSNDRLPPTSLLGLPLLDNIPNWEFGVLVMVRDTARILRNDFSRSQSQSREDPDLANAEPSFNFPNDSWLFPPTEREYRKGIRHLDAYLQRLASRNDPNTQFYARADNLNELLAVVQKRLGSLSQRLNASKEDVRINTDLAGDTAARQATEAPQLLVVKTPWLEIDDVFYEARGYVWALLQVLKAVEIDFEPVLKKKNAVASMRQVIRLLEQTQIPPSSPVVLNGDPMGWLANYSKTLVSYISPANAAIIDLHGLLSQG